MSCLRILILEDDENRNNAFRRKFIGHVVKIVTRAKDAIDCLSNSDWDVLFLDHDLGGEQMVKSGPGTGYEVAEWLEENNSRKPKNIYVHSLNPVGAANIRRILPEAICTPFIWSR